MTAVSPFHPRTAGLNSKMAWSEWATYLSPAGYADMHDIEYTAVREAAAVFDVSPLYKYIVSGPDAVRLVDRVITRDATRLEVGQVAYTPWCDEGGKVVDDGTVARLDEARFRWTAADPQYRWLGMNAAGLDVEIEDVTDAVAALALQGPRSRAVLEAVTAEGWGDLRYFRRRSCAIAGAEVDVSRTGYTGDLGYELWMPAASAIDVWDALFAAGEQHGIRPAGLRALDVVRIEAGLILIEVDYTSVMRATTPAHEYSPFEIGLGRLVNFEKAHFVGRRALLRERTRGRAAAPPGRARDRLGRDRARLRAPRPAAGRCADGVARAGAGLRTPRPGRQGDEHVLVADPEEDGGAGVGGSAPRGSGNAARDRVDGRGRAGPRRCDGRGVAVPRPSPQARDRLTRCPAAHRLAIAPGPCGSSGSSRPSHPPSSRRRTGPALPRPTPICTSTRRRVPRRRTCSAARSTRPATWCPRGSPPTGRGPCWRGRRTSREPRRRPIRCRRRSAAARAFAPATSSASGRTTATSRSWPGPSRTAGGTWVILRDRGAVRAERVMLAAYQCPACGRCAGPAVERPLLRPCPDCLADLRALERRPDETRRVRTAIEARAEAGLAEARALHDERLEQRAESRRRWARSLRRAGSDDLRAALLAAFTNAFDRWTAPV